MKGSEYYGQSKNKPFKCPCCRRKTGTGTGKAAAGSGSIEEKDLVTDEMLTGLKQTFQDKIDAVAISENIGSCTANNGTASANILLSGINDGYFASSKITLLAGRRIKASDIEGNKRVIMISDKAAKNLFNSINENILCQKIAINYNGKYEDFYITGIYKYEENTFSSDSSSNITTAAYIPLSAAKELLHSYEGYSQFTVVTAQGTEDISLFAEEIEQYLKPYYINNEEFLAGFTTWVYGFGANGRRHGRDFSAGDRAGGATRCVFYGVYERFEFCVGKGACECVGATESSTNGCADCGTDLGQKSSTFRGVGWSVGRVGI